MQKIFFTDLPTLFSFRTITGNKQFLFLGLNITHNWQTTDRQQREYDVEKLPSQDVHSHVLTVPKRLAFIIHCSFTMHTVITNSVNSQEILFIHNELIMIFLGFSPFNMKSTESLWIQLNHYEFNWITMNSTESLWIQQNHYEYNRILS